MRIAILQCENLPSFITWYIPNVDEYFEDDRMLQRGLQQHGHEATLLQWTNTSIDWNEYDIAVIRSTWDYIDRREEFLSVLSKIESSSCKLFNPLEAVRWNSDKHYFFDLQKWNVPVIPTYNPEIQSLTDIREEFLRNNWDEVVFKPSIGGGGSGLHRTHINDIESEYSELKKKNPQHQYLLQPLIKSVRSSGEWSYIFIDRRLCHVMLKKPAAGDYRAHGIYGGSNEAAYPPTDEIKQAESILAALPFDLLYARLDLVKMDERLVVMEVELIEPVLYFSLFPEGVEMFVEAVITKGFN